MFYISMVYMITSLHSCDNAPSWCRCCRWVSRDGGQLWSHRGKSGLERGGDRSEQFVETRVHNTCVQCVGGEWAGYYSCACQGEGDLEICGWKVLIFTQSRHNCYSKCIMNIAETFIITRTRPNIVIIMSIAIKLTFCTNTACSQRTAMRSYSPWYWGAPRRCCCHRWPSQDGLLRTRAEWGNVLWGEGRRVWV